MHRTAKRNWIRLFIVLTGVLFSGPVAAKTIIVTRTDDVIESKPAIFGSLRDAIRNRADPGDTVVFQVHGPVTLLDVITVPPNLAGLTLQGPVILRPSRGTHGVLVIEADNVTVRKVTFAGGSVLVQRVFAGAEFRINGANLLDNDFRGDAEVFLSQVDNCNVVDNHLIVSPDPASTGDTALATSFTRDCRISKNLITTTSDFAMVDHDSQDIRIIDNDVTRGISIFRPSSGEISEKNRFGGPLSIHPPDRGETSGLLTVSDNRTKRVTVNRTNIHLLDNVITGSGPASADERSALFIDNGDPRGPQGDVLIRDNIIRGGTNGISYRESVTAAPAEILDNDVSGCTNAGISILFGSEVRVAHNTVHDCGTGTIGEGILIGLTDASGIVVERNTLTNIAGAGVVVTPQLDGIEVVVRENEIIANDAAGIVLLRNPDRRTGHILMEGNTITGNAHSGIVGEFASNGTVLGGEIRDNGRDGISVLTESSIEIRHVSMGNNTGPGIDIAQDGVTPNTETKLGNHDLDWPENLRINPHTLKLEGTAVPGGTVEVFAVEAGARTGNPENGEGEVFLGAALVDDTGNFAFPAEGVVACPPTRLITLTATIGGLRPATSEFSPDFDCVLPDPGSRDDDGDGVLNSADLCPDTPAGEAVDADGCGDSQRDDDACGNEQVEGPGEQCDLGALNGAPGSCCTAECQLESASTECNASEGACDFAAFCTGTSPFCPPNELNRLGHICRLPTGDCDSLEFCLGVSPACPADVHFPAGTVCRDSAGACDMEETCTGETAECPADARAAIGAVCRESGDLCDVAEFCDGIDPACPPDELLEAGTVCRPSLDGEEQCDLAESCDGVAASCPSDARADDGTPCGDLSCDSGSCLFGLCDFVVQSCGNDVLQATCGEACDGTDDDACPGECLADCTCPSSPVCGPGPHWIDTCPAGEDHIDNFHVEIGVDSDDDCVTDEFFNLNGIALVELSGPLDFSNAIANFGGADGHPDVIDLEFTDAEATDGFIILGLGSSAPTAGGPTVGAIIEITGVPAAAFMRIEFRPEIDLGFGPLHFVSPAPITTDQLRRFPFNLEITAPDICVALYDGSSNQVPEKITAITIGLDVLDPVCGDGVVSGNEECESETDCAGNPCLENCTCEGGAVCSFDPCVGNVDPPSEVCQEIDECVIIIGGIDPFCLNITWDQLCADRAGEFCGDRCLEP